MNLIKKFNKIAKRNNCTFHDYDLVNLNFIFGEIKLLLEIQKNNFNDFEELVNKTKMIFIFKDIKILDFNFFSNEIFDNNEYSEISSFELEKNEKFIIEGIKGWKITFLANDFYFKEEIINSS